MVKLQRTSFLIFLVTCWFSSSVLASMPTFFNADESRFDRYAACLAATEKLRRDGNRYDDSNKEEFIRDASKILKGLGSSLEEYNEIGREILGNSDLKEKVNLFSNGSWTNSLWPHSLPGQVMSQAFLYRMESSITEDKMPIEEINDTIVKVVKGDKLQRFSKCMFEIERLRRVQLGKLNSLSGLAAVVPEGSLTTVTPLLRPEARGLVEDFPVQATAIATRHGLSAKEFNVMLQTTRKSASFRKRVHAAFKK